MQGTEHPPYGNGFNIEYLLCIMAIIFVKKSYLWKFLKEKKVTIGKTMKAHTSHKRCWGLAYILLLLSLHTTSFAAQPLYELPLSRNDSARWHLNDSLAASFEQQGSLREASQRLDDNGMLFWERNRLAKAVEYFQRSLVINEQLGNHNGIAGINSNLAFIYSDLEKYEKALEFLEKTLTVRRSEKKKVGIISTLINESVVLNQLNRYGESVTKLEEALSLAQEMNDETQMRSVYGMLSETYQKAGDAEKAMYYYNYYRTFNDYVAGEAVRQAKSEVARHKLQEENLQLQNRNNELELAQQRWQLSQQASSIEELSGTKRQLLDSLGAAEVVNRMLTAENDRERMRSEALEQSKRRTTMLLWIVVLGIAIALLALSFALVVIRYKNRYNRVLEKKNAKIAEQAEAVTIANTDLQAVNDTLEERNELILSSIRASRDVQNAVFDYSTPIHSLFPQSFLYEQARDIVSGDFHYARIAPDGTRILVVGDCTGHGVSAAFLTILAIATIDRIIFDKRIRTPSAALTELDNVFSNLNKGKLVTLHSMDVAMICVPPSGERIDFAGAKNGIILAAPSGIKYFRGSHFEIGGSSVQIGRNKQQITTQRIPLDEPTWCYLYSDGMIDQFNEQGQKFSSPRLRSLLGNLYKLDAKAQYTEIHNALSAWRGKTDQIDDQILAGIKIEKVCEKR